MQEKRLRPPYAAVVNEYEARANQIGTEFAERMSKVSKALESGANCDAITIAFTHPHFLES